MFKDKIIKVNTDVPTNINREVMGVLANHQWYRAFDKAEDRLGNLEKGIRKQINKWHLIRQNRKKSGVGCQGAGGLCRGIAFND